MADVLAQTTGRHAAGYSIASTRLPDGAIRASMGSLAVIIRESDGWLHATSLAASVAKFVSAWSSLKGTKETIDVLKEELGIEVIEQVVTGPNDQRGSWIHPDLTASFAMSMSKPYAIFVARVMRRYEAGDLSVAAEVIENHDSAHNTTSTVLINTISNDLMDTDEGEGLGKRRWRSIEATKSSNAAIHNRAKFGRSVYVKIADAMNQAGFNTELHTVAFRKLHGIPKKKSPRQFAQAKQQTGFVFMANAVEELMVNMEDSTEALQKSMRAIKAVGDIMRLTGVSSMPLLKQPIVPIPLALPGLATGSSRKILAHAAAGGPMRAIRNQAELTDFFAPRVKH